MADAARPADFSDVSVVGIGASAGGLEALEQFLGSAAPDCGLAFVVVQHLDPTHKDMMVELLQRATALPVVQITDGMPVAPNHVYVLPPNRDLSILHGVLYLLDPVAPRGLRLPVDYFFRALAADRRERSIGVILSGMGSDGTLGLRAIKEQAGAAFVQDPASAKFDGMPRSAIDAGLADVVAPAEELADRIAIHMRHAPHNRDAPGADLTDKNRSGLEKVVLLLRAQSGHDFSEYKKSTLYRRIDRRMGLHQLPRIADYVNFLRENPQEGQLLFKELLIGVTSFFRDPPVWEQLRDEVIPALLARYPNGGTLRAWVAACSTGEEAYSLAIVFREALEKIKPAAHYALQIFATDLDVEAIGKARAAAYPANIATDVSEDRLRRYFVQDERGYKLNKVIREMAIFAPQNVAMDPPFTKLDLLSCRNLLIYLEPELQRKLLTLFQYSLLPGGVLLLGTSETVGHADNLFAPLAGATRLYRRLPATRALPLEFPSAIVRSNPDVVDVRTGAPTRPGLPPVNLEKLTDSLLLRHFAPAAVLTTDQGDLVYVSGKTGKYLEPAAGKANLNVFAMARDGLVGPLSAAFPKAVREKAIVVLDGLVVGANGSRQHVDVTIQFLTEPAELRGLVLIVFADIAAPRVAAAAGKARRGGPHAAQLAALAAELQQSQANLQSTREEMQSAQEELKSANEELQSTNEELQSTNEELTSSKEEMQSMNEELQTVNHELTAKVNELSLASDDMKNLLNSTDIATLFLDEHLKVRSFTTSATRIIKLIPGDAGRPITDLASDLDYADLPADAQEVLRTLVFREREVASRDGRWFAVRIMPYRTQANRIDGVVITFVDITTAKALEAALRETLALLQAGSDMQADELTAHSLEAALRQTQDILEKGLRTAPGHPTT